MSSDGSLTESAQALLEATIQPVTAGEAARRAGLPLFLTRSGLRELVAARMVVERDGRYQRLTAGG